MTEPFNIGYADAQVYEDMLPPHYYFGREDIDLVRDHLHDVYGNPRQHNGLHALDLGCGPGRVTSALAAYADTLTGTDKSSGMIARFSSRFPAAEAHCVDTETIVAQFAEQHRRFDLVGSFWSMSYPLLECFETTTADGVTVTGDLDAGTARAHALITHLIDLLAPGGRLVMLFFDAATPEQRLVTRLWERVHPFPGTGRDFTWNLLLRELHDAEAAGRGQLTTRRVPGVAVTLNVDAALQWFRIGHLNSFAGLVDDPEVVMEITDFARAHERGDGRVLMPSGVHLVDFHASSDPAAHLPREFR
ncbi:class I SAM-dependent methyltransferase [Nocardia sp. alder85J]|uniref:methyltransferase domain-containing protein n=1 Tax=Nocardia sp. alder85J TaxID=2862949 RepID=UPI001CD26E86|nr:class I SAM-dependent methyltransferase [Nocardia sp. alder85J]MCX4093187.1 class I SAM-dependent methyltransferase [Nocardia sp. alder85J]